MRFLVLSSLLCILLFCFSIFSVEGKRRRPKLCCSQGSNPVVMAQKERLVKICKPCKVKTKSKPWVVPGALPQV